MSAEYISSQKVELPRHEPWCNGTFHYFGSAFGRPNIECVSATYIGELVGLSASPPLPNQPIPFRISANESIAAINKILNDEESTLEPIAEVVEIAKIIDAYYASQKPNVE